METQQISAKELSTIKLLLVTFGLMFVKEKHNYIEKPKYRLKTTFKTMFNKEYVVSVDKVYFNGKFNPFYGK